MKYLLCSRRSAIALSLLALAQAASALPPPIAGSVSRLRGRVELLMPVGAKPLTLAVGDALPEGARIQTGTGARLEARMKDGTLLTLGEQTEFLVLQVANASIAADGASRFELLKGVFRAITSKIATGQASSSWQVRTPVALIGVRGTELWGGFNLLEAGARTLDVVMLEGHGVYVTNSHGTTELGQSGDGTTVQDVNTAPLPIVPWGEKKLQAALASVAW